MFVAAFVPFFLAVQLPIEDGAWPYGPEYIFTVHMNETRIPQCPHHTSVCGDPSGYRITSRLHCIPKRNDILSCSLRYVSGFNFGIIDEENEMSRRRSFDASTELFFNEKGIENIITSQRTHVYDLNILKMVAEQLHPGDDFNNIGDGTFKGVTASTIGRCNVTFGVYHRSENENAETKFQRRFRLKLLPWNMHITSTETLVIDKTTNLNDCSCYADFYYRKIGNTVVYEVLSADLEHMVSHMEISETSFSSSTTRKGTSISNNNKTYNIIEITKIILEDIQPAARDPPAIVKPGETKILANHDIRSISVGYY